MSEVDVETKIELNEPNEPNEPEPEPEDDGLQAPKIKKGRPKMTDDERAASAQKQAADRKLRLAKAKEIKEAEKMKNVLEGKPKRQVSEAQMTNLAKGREKALANRKSKIEDIKHVIQKTAEEAREDEDEKFMRIYKKMRAMELAELKSEDKPKPNAKEIVKADEPPPPPPPPTTTPPSTANPFRSVKGTQSKSVAFAGFNFI